MSDMNPPSHTRPGLEPVPRRIRTAIRRANLPFPISRNSAAEVIERRSAGFPATRFWFFNVHRCKFLLRQTVARKREPAVSCGVGMEIGVIARQRSATPASCDPTTETLGRPGYSGVGEVADISTVARSLIDERADFAGTSKSPFAPALARFPLTVMIAVPTLETGAADEDAVELARTLTAAGHRAVVVSCGGRLEGELAACGAQFVRLDMASINPVVIARNAFVLARLIRQRHCGVVHALARAPGWSGYAAARMTGVAFLTTWYGGFRDQNLFKHAYNGVMARGEQVIAMSDQIADIIAERHRVAADRIIVIPSHIDIARFDPTRIEPERVDAVRAAWGVGPGTRVIMVVGRILRRKGHHVVVRAARRLKDMGLRDFAFVLVGEDNGSSSYSGELWDLVMTTKTTDVIRIAGPPADEPAAYMGAAAVISAAIQLESPQRPLLEAME